MRARASSYRYRAPHGLRSRRRRLFLGVPAGAIGAALLGVTAALAFFTATSNSGANSAAALAGAIGTGQTPGTTVSGRDVTVSWAITTNALTYTIARTNTVPGGLSPTVHGSCAGSVAAFICTDTGLPVSGTTAATWTYTDTPARYNWVGTTSGASTPPIAVPDPTLSLASSTFTTGGGTTNATVANFFDSEGVTYCVDSSSSCPAGMIAGTDAVPATGGTKTTALTIPAGLSVGAHTMFAIGSIGSHPSAPFVVTPGTASKLAFTTEPGGGPSGTTWSQQPVVTVQDALGNTVTSDNSTVTLAINSQPGSGATLTCTGGLSKQAVNGVATFAGCQIAGQVGSYTLVATDGSLTAATSTAFNITPGAATQLVYLQQPTNAVAGSTITPSVTVQVEDASGNVETGDNATTVTLAIGTNPGGGTLSGTTTRTVASGVATFNDLSINKTGTGYTLNATSSPAHGTTASSAFNITVGAATQLVFTQQPTNTAAGATMTPSVTVAVEDANGNVETGDTTTTVTLAIGTNAGGGTLSGTLTKTVASGVATFNNLSIDKTGTGYTLSATSSPAHGTTVSGTFNINPGAATHLVFTSQPAASANIQATGTGTFSASVAVEDANSNVVTTDSTTAVTLAIGTNPSSGVLSCTGGLGPVTVSSGVASFTGCAITKTGTGYKLTASSSPSYAAPSNANAFNITAGTATQLVYLQQPTNTVAGSSITPSVTVQVEDANGNVEVGDSTTTVTLSIGTNPGGGTLSGTATQTAASGVATFNNLSINKTGTGYTLNATSNPAHGTTASSTFNITPGAATQLVYTQQPTNTVAGATITPSVTVAVEDANGNVETGDSTTTVTLAIGTNAGGGTLSGTLTKTVASGVATFSNLSINKTGTGYTLNATSNPAHGTTTSSPFNITVAAASQLAFTVQPAAAANIQATGTGTFSASVAVEDANGNVVTTDSTTAVTLAIGTNPSSGVLSCTNTGGLTVTVSSGVASFTGCAITKTGTGYKLTASSSPSYTAPSNANAFNITAGTATQLVYLQQPTNTVAGSTITPSVTVQVEDANGNVETGDSSTTVTLAIGTNAGGGTLSGTATQTAASGVATFNDLSINKTGTGYTLNATSNPAHGTTASSTFNITVGAATQLVYTQQPTNTVAGSTITPSVTVAVEDANGNVETGDTTTSVTLAIGTNAGGGTLSGTLTKTAASGVATFNDLSINKTGTGYTLNATSSPAHGTTTSSLFNITVGAATQLGFTVQPAASANIQATGTGTFSASVAVEDANANVVTTDNATTVTLAIGTNASSGALTCTGGLGPTPVSSGVASFTGCAITKAGTGYKLTASSSPSRTAPSNANAFNITAGTATQLVYLQQPTNTVAGSTITPSVTVQVEDANGNVEVGDTTTTVTLAIGTNPGGGTLSGTATQTASSGVATFNDLSINKTGTGYTLNATSNPAHGTTASSLFNIAVGAATQLAFTVQPVANANIQATGTSTFSASVAVEDANGNVETGDTTTAVTLAIGTNPSSGALTCTGGLGPTTVSSGVASFTGCAITKTGTGYKLTASSSPSRTAPSNANAFNITAGTATQLVYLQQPTNTVAGTTITPSVTVQVEDANGNVEVGDTTTTVTLAIGTNPSSGTLSGTLTRTAASGVATFNDLSINNAGSNYTLNATSFPVHGTTASSTFNITAGTPHIVSVSVNNKTGGTLGKAEAGDTIVFTYSSVLKMTSICSASTLSNTSSGSITPTSTSTTVTLTKVSPNTPIAFASTDCTLHLGSITLPTNYVGGANGGTLKFALSTVAWNGSNTITVTLGSTVTGSTMTDTNPYTNTFNPDTAVTDPSGTAISGTQFSWMTTNF
jgi:hypothetical protein